MILADSGQTTAIISVLTAVALVLGAYSAFLSRKTDSKTATREEINQAFRIQGEIITSLRTEVAAVKQNHEDCERRLAKLESTRG